MDDRTRCAELAENLAEVATGAASGPDRGRVLAHLGSCEACRRELAELTEVADEVLLLAPEHEPPAGFESAVLAKIDAAMGGSAPEPAAVVPIGSARRRRYARPLAAAAAAVTLALGSGAAVWQATEPDRSLAASYRDTLDVADGQYFSAVDLLAPDGTSAGTVFFYEGEPSWLFVVVRAAPEPGTYSVVVQTDSTTTNVGTCLVEETTCSVGTAIDSHVYSVEEIRLEAGGVTLTARLDH